MPPRSLPRPSPRNGLAARERQARPSQPLSPDDAKRHAVVALPEFTPTADRAMLAAAVSGLGGADETARVHTRHGGCDCAVAARRADAAARADAPPGRAHEPGRG